MERVATLLGPLLGITWLLLLHLPGTQATGRRLSGYSGPLPPCNKVPGGIPRWDCYDPPNIHPLPPCDFHHQRIGFDCSGWPAVSHEGDASPTTFKSKTRPMLERHIAIDLPPCSVGSHDGTDSWQCYDAHTWPPAVGSDHVGEASQAVIGKSETMQEEQHIAIDLPPCSVGSHDGTDSWQCYDTRTWPPAGH